MKIITCKNFADVSLPTGQTFCSIWLSGIMITSIRRESEDSRFFFNFAQNDSTGCMY